MKLFLQLVLTLTSTPTHHITTACHHDVRRRHLTLQNCMQELERVADEERRERRKRERAAEETLQKAAAEVRAQSTAKSMAGSQSVLLSQCINRGLGRR